MGLFNKSDASKSDFKKHYSLQDKLGAGNFAVVKKAKKTSKNPNVDVPEVVAVKLIDKSKCETMNDVQREIDIMQTAHHPNVIRLFEIYDEPATMHLVMELVTGGELLDRVVDKGSYSEQDAAQVMLSLCDALEYLHGMNIIHRDLKPENVLYASAADDAPIKVADFGLARVLAPEDMARTSCGTPTYVAPEVLRNEGYSSGAVDMWSAGVILYVLLCGFPPFYEDDGEDLNDLFAKIMNANFTFPSPWWDDISYDAKDLILKLLEVDTETRLTAAQAKAHPWMSSASGEALGHADNLKKLRATYNAAASLKRIAQERAGAGRISTTSSKKLSMGSKIRQGSRKFFGGFKAKRVIPGGVEDATAASNADFDSPSGGARDYGSSEADTY